MFSHMTLTKSISKRHHQKEKTIPKTNLKFAFTSVREKLRKRHYLKTQQLASQSNLEPPTLTQQTDKSAKTITNFSFR